MTPSTSANLDRFLKRYETTQAFFLAPGYAEPGSTFPSVNSKQIILCTQLHVRPAWEIGENDPDMIGIFADDKVSIPDGITDPPVLRALERAKKRHAHKSETEPRTRPPGRGARVGRNDPCPCGSGKKFKKCCGR
jgi:hypothetical protein